MRFFECFRFDLLKVKLPLELFTKPSFRVLYAGLLTTENLLYDFDFLRVPAFRSRDDLPSALLALVERRSFT